jgi:hypothetical protein
VLKSGVEADCKFYEFFLEPVVDQIMEEASLSDLPSLDTNTETEKKAKYRKSISDLVYDKEGMYHIKEGFDLIIANLDRLPGGQIVKKELIALGSRQLEKISKTILGNEDKIAKKMLKARDILKQD